MLQGVIEVEEVVGCPMTATNWNYRSGRV